MKIHNLVQYTIIKLNCLWKNSNGDIVDEMSKSCRKYGIKFAVYLPPWNENLKYYGKGQEYNDYSIKCSFNKRRINS